MTVHGIRTTTTWTVRAGKEKGSIRLSERNFRRRKEYPSLPGCGGVKRTMAGKRTRAKRAPPALQNG